MGNTVHLASSKRPSLLARGKDVAQARAQGRVKTVLLLGAGESGKSTIFQQMKLCYGTGFDENYRITKGSVILRNAIELTARVISTYNFSSSSAQTEVAKQTVLDHFHADKFSLNKDLAKALADLSSDPDFIALINNQAKSIVQDGFLRSLEKCRDYPTYGGNHWLPSDEDLLEARVRTTGVTNEMFQVNSVFYNIIDIGGQRAERKKYFGLFEKADEIIFVASLSDYDLALFEAPEQNRVVESLSLFSDICNSRKFPLAIIVLFLNKFDLFKIKYKVNKIPLPVLDDVEPPPKAEEDDENCKLALNWFTTLYLNKSGNRVRATDVHITTATDSKLMKIVIDSVVSFILQQMLDQFKIA